jgi:hypothetical protein
MDHDRLFKELLTVFLPDFLQVFCPELAAYVDMDSLKFLDKEVFTDVTRGEKHEADLVVHARFRGKPVYFLIHVEPQARQEDVFSQRMFMYFARLHEKYDLPIYPICVLSYRWPKRRGPDTYRVEFPDLTVLIFRYRAVQLNQMEWREFEQRTSPIVAALMATMHRARGEEARVKLACLRMLANLQLDPARRQLISGFVDSYLQLTMKQEREFEAGLQELHPQEREDVMEIVTSWEKRGVAKGLAQGLEQGKRELVLRLLRKQVGDLDAAAQEQIESLSAKRLEKLGEALLSFAGPEDLDAWLRSNGRR